MKHICVCATFCSSTTCPHKYPHPHVSGACRHGNCYYADGVFCIPTRTEMPQDCQDEHSPSGCADVCAGYTSLAGYHEAVYNRLLADVMLVKCNDIIQGEVGMQSIEEWSNTLYPNSAGANVSREERYTEYVEEGNACVALAAQCCTESAVYHSIMSAAGDTVTPPLSGIYSEIVSEDLLMKLR